VCRYGRFGAFFADEGTADVIGIIWAPSPAKGSVISVKDASSTYPLSLAGLGNEGDKGGESLPDVVAMLSGMMAMGEGLVKEVEVLHGARIAAS